MRNSFGKLTTAVWAAACVGVLSTVPAQGGTLDLTGGGTGNCVAAGGTIVAVSYCDFAGALWTTTDVGSTGTGVIDSFVRVSSANEGTVSGMNTNGGLTQDENSSPQFTHDIQGKNVPVVIIDGDTYYEFLLDINQTKEDPNLALTELELCYNASGAQRISGDNISCVDTAGADGITNTNTSFYNLDGAVDDTVVLNYSLNEGSGSGDLFVYIPTNAAIGPNTFVYLFSQFGLDPNQNNDGFEEWAVRTANPISPVPEPASLLLLGSGLAGVCGYARRMRKARQART